MKNLVLLSFILLSGMKILACSCNTPKKALEFYASDYVLEAIALEKTINSDSTHYKVKFEIIEQYKDLEEIDFAVFNFTYQKAGERDSCYWEIDEGEKWLIYAHRNEDELTFNYMCSNSKPLKKPLDKEYQNFLKNAINFNPSKYTFSSLDGLFKIAKPKKNIDSIISELVKRKGYKTRRVDIVIDVDKNGNLIAANLLPKDFSERGDKIIIDTIYELNKPPNVEYRSPENTAESDFLNIIRQAKRWDKVYIQNTETSVKTRQYIQFHIEKDTIKLYY